jgi:adenosylcobinamide kinase/adenosylcobinamide-phosphate guanylyltransferase
MAADLRVVHSELLLGGQRSGKSRRAEQLAQAWLGQAAHHQAVLVATATAWDAEMRARIRRHQEDRLQRVPRMRTVEEPLALAAALRAHSRAETLLVVDCLTLWLTNLRMPATMEADGGLVAGAIAATAAETGMATVAGADAGSGAGAGADSAPAVEQLLSVLGTLPGPVVLVGNEIGLGVVPMGAEVRAFVDALGWLNQQVASRCARVTLMAAGLPLVLKDGAC